MTADRQFCTFYLDDIFFGVDVEKVQEVVCWQEMTRVPLAPPVVLRAHQPARPDRHRPGTAAPPGAAGTPGRPRPVNVVVRADDVPTSLLVDQIGDVLEVSEEAFERPPETLGAWPAS